MLKKKRQVAWLLVMVMLLSLVNPCVISVQAEESNTVVKETTTDEIIDESATKTEMVTEEVTTEITTEVEATTEQPTQENVSEQITTEETTQESVKEEETILEESVEENPTTEKNEEENTDNSEACSTNESTDVNSEQETLQPIFDEVITNVKSEGLDRAYVIYNDGTWATDKYRWYVNVSGKKHYVFCLNYGKTMQSGLYYGNLTAGYSGISAFRKSVALNYFYKVNGNSWNGNKHYGDVQYAIWDSEDTDISSKLLTYANRAWKLTDLNDERVSGTSSYSSKLKGIKKSNTLSAQARKKMIANLTDSKHIIDLSSSFDAESVSYKDTIKLGGTAWKYFNNGGFNGGDSDIVVDGVYNTDGSETSSCIASIDDNGNLVVSIKPTIKDGNNATTAYTVIMHVKFDYMGSDSINYLLTPDGKQNLTYNADNNSDAYFALRVYGKEYYDSAKLHINKVDEFDNFVSGCTFRLTGVEGDATQMTPRNKTINSESDYFEIEYPGYYKLVETAVPSSEYKLDTTERYVYAKYNDDTKLIIYLAKKNDDGTYEYGGLSSSVTGSGTASFSYTFRNLYNSGAATLSKFANVLTRYENGKFIYEKRTLDDVGFTFFAAEDIYLGEQLIFEKGEELFDGTEWGYNPNSDSLIPGVGVSNVHSITIDGKLVVHGVAMGPFTRYRGYTANGGKLTISDLPPGSYYCLESDLSNPNLVMAVERYYFDVVANQTVSINGADGILNEQAPADISVYKLDENTKEFLSGAEFTIYANINNANYDGDKLFKASQTVDVVIQRNLATGKEVVESGTWIPLQTVTSNIDGLALFENMPYGDYLIAETKAPDGYELPEKTIRFTHSLPETTTANNASGFVFKYEMGNIKTSSFSIYKKAEKAYLNNSNEKNVDAYIYKEEPIQGVIFGVYADEEIKNTLGEVVFKQGDLITTCTTNAEGVAQFGGALYAGKYYFLETQTADNSIYELDQTKHPFEVTGKESTKILTDEALVNKQYKGSIKVIKTDGKTKIALSNVEFNLLDADKKVMGTYVTDKKGEILINNLPIGTYYIQESKTKKGYKLNDNMLEVVITVEDLHKQVEFKNYHSDTSITIKTDTTYSGSGQVRTGDMSPIGFILLLFIMSSCGFGALCVTGKKKESLKPLSVRAKKFMVIALVLASSMIVGGLTVKAAVELKELSSEELRNVEYNRTVYKYALKKQYETSNPGEEYVFDQEKDGMKLVDVKYETIDMILQKETLETTKDYKDLLVKDEGKVADTVTLNGNVYKLQNITWSEEPNIETVSYTLDHGYQTAEPTPDATYEYTYTSPITKKDNTVTLPFVRLEKGSAAWVDGFSATVTFHNIDGKYFKLGNHEFEYNSNKLSLTDGDFKNLVKMLGYDTSKYRLTSIAWSGKEYKKNGQMCRDAKAIGQQYAASYKAHYEDEVENGKIYTAHATYSCEVEVPADEAAPTYVRQATAYYEKTSISPVVMTVGVVIAVVLVIAILYVLSRKKKNVSSGSINF